MRLAFVTPLNSRATGVAEYSRQLLAGLHQISFQDMQVFSADDAPQLNAQPLSGFEAQAAEFDLIIYQMGNSAAHDFMSPYLFDYPGLVVLHDLSLLNFFARQAAAGNSTQYYRALGFGDGTRGTEFAYRHLKRKTAAPYPQYLASEWLAARSLGVIVHSHHAINLLQARCPSANLFSVSQPVPVLDPIAPAAARAQLHIPADTFLTLLNGILTASKNPIAILDAIDRLRADGLSAQVAFIGSENFSFQLQPAIEARGLNAAVHTLGFLDRSGVNAWLSAADAGVNLRQMYFGETSASALTLLAAGLPLVVTRIGAFAELPDEACFKIDPQETDVAQAVYAALKQLASDTPLRDRMGHAARQYVIDHCEPEHVAREYLSIAHAIVSGGSPDFNRKSILYTDEHGFHG